MSLSLAEAVDAYTAGVDALLAADVDESNHRDLLTHFARIDTGSSRVPMAQYAILARLQHEAAPKDLGATSWNKLLRLRTRMSKGAAAKLLTRSTWLAPRRTLHGDQLPPQWAHTAAGLSCGAFGDEHVAVIAKFFKALPSSVDPITRDDAEQTLAECAAELDPRSLTIAAMHLLALLHPDGEEPADAAAKKAGLTLGPQQPDGLSYLSGWVTPKLRALIEPVIAKFAERGRHPTPQAEPAAEDTALPPAEPVLDCQWRTKAQYTHDAFEAALDLLLRSNTLGTLNGLPATVVVTTTLQDLERAAGYAVTGGGSRLPMRDLIDLAAAGAHHYLAVFDGHTGQTLHFGRARRRAGPAQKLALFARERGCSEPGCDAPWYDCQAHHGVADWKNNGQTDIDDLTLACGPGNQLIEDTDWTTRRRKDGRFEWIRPTHLDTGQPRVNSLHHPERLLAPRDDDPF